jgi:uncharacterized protein (DUF924 family)
MKPTQWIADVLKFWFGLTDEQWWRSDDAIDHRTRQSFLKLWAEKRELPVEAFLTDPLTALAAVILFDQFPRNMFRGHADQFSTDPLAIAIARNAIARGYDDGMTSAQRGFLYLPFEHSESLADQRQSLLLYTALADSNLLGYARKHYEVIEKFGRFPHRNAMLARKPTALEAAAGDVVPW